LSRLKARRARRAQAVTMAERSILIIGAGIGGLSTGCYARMNGYRSRILERHGVSGGVCAAWMRGGYVFDGCIHNLSGTRPGGRANEMWRELGVVPDRLLLPFSEMVRVERPDCEPMVVWSNLDRLQAELVRQFPADEGPISELVSAARKLTGLDLLGLPLADRAERLRALAYAPLLARYAMTMEVYAKRFQDRFLASAFPHLLYDWPDQPVAMFLTLLAGLHTGDLGWPVGGSYGFAQAIERRFLELGGEIAHNTRVTSIIVQDDRAVGVRLADGSEEHADIVVSNAYGPETIFEMLGGRYVNDAIRRAYADPEDRVEMGLQISFGLARDLSAEPHAIVLPLPEPAVIAGETRSALYVEPFGFDPSLAPPGKSVLKVMLGTSFALWEGLHETPERYRQEKQKAADEVLRLLEPRFPGIGRQVEMLDVATPMTTLRYTGNGRGFRMPATRLALGLFTGRRLSMTLPGLADFYMVGQWAGLPGIGLVAAMGREVAQAICRRHGRSFQAAAPAETPSERLTGRARSGRA
jgi:phytoene dehydrogenase-like protein